MITYAYAKSEYSRAVVRETPLNGGIRDYGEIGEMTSMRRTPLESGKLRKYEEIWEVRGNGLLEEDPWKLGNQENMGNYEKRSA